LFLFVVMMLDIQHRPDAARFLGATCRWRPFVGVLIVLELSA